MKLIYTDDLITDEEWGQLLGMQLNPVLTKLLALLRRKGDKAIPVGELPDFFRGTHVPTLNGVFSKAKMPFRLASDGNQPWMTVLPYERRSLKLYKVRQPEKKAKAPEKPKGPPRCPPIFFNPNWNRRPASSITGTAKIEFIGIKDEEYPWRNVAMEIQASISIGVGGKGFLHFLPNREQMDKIIHLLQEMRELIPEE